MNIFALIILISYSFFYLINEVARFLSVRTFQKQIPQELTDHMSQREYANARALCVKTAQVRFLRDTSMFALFLLFWLFGGFEIVDEIVRDFGRGPVLSGVLYFFIAALDFGIVLIPFMAWSKYIVVSHTDSEATFGKILFIVTIRYGVTAIVVGAVILSIMFSLYEWAGVMSWLVVFAFLLLILLGISDLAPTLTNDPDVVSPLAQNHSLRQAIYEHAGTLKFRYQDIMVIDDQLLPKKENIIFQRFGPNRLISIRESLFSKLASDELAGVVFQKIASFQSYLLWKRYVLPPLVLAVFFWMLSSFIDHPGLFEAFYVSHPTPYAGLLLFLLLFAPIELAGTIPYRYFMRRLQLRADRLAMEITGNGEALLRGLKKLNFKRLINPSPHWLDVVLNYREPPFLHRIRSLRNTMNPSQPEHQKSQF